MFLLSLLACTQSVHFPPSANPADSGWTTTTTSGLHDWNLSASCENAGLGVELTGDLGIDQVILLATSSSGGAQTHQMEVVQRGAQSHIRLSPRAAREDEILSAGGVCAAGGALSLGFRAYGEGQLLDCLVTGQGGSELAVSLASSDPQAAQLGCRLVAF